MFRVCLGLRRLGQLRPGLHNAGYARQAGLLPNWFKKYGTYYYSSVAGQVEPLVGQVEPLAGETPKAVRPPAKPHRPQASNSLVDSAEGVKALVNTIQALPKGEPHLYIDLQGIKLGRLGSISIMSVLVNPLRHVYVVDVHKLQSEVFHTPGTENAGKTTLRAILESPAVPKVFFEVRQDADALYHHFGVGLRGVEDLQLMDVLAHPGPPGALLHNFEKCVCADGMLPESVKTEWMRIRDAGRRMWHPRHGGSFDVFNSRPMDPRIQLYCANEVQYLPRLRQSYWNRMSDKRRIMAKIEAKNRVDESLAPQYDHCGWAKKMSPWGLRRERRNKLD